MLDSNLITQAERLASLYKKSSESAFPYQKVRELLQKAGISSGNLVPDLDLYFSTQAPPGTEQWRVYYQIDNFDQVHEPKRSELQRSEDARIKQFGFRFYPSSTPDKATYDKAQIGDQLEVRYRYMGDEKEIISIRNLTHPDS